MEFMKYFRQFKTAQIILDKQNVLKEWFVKEVVFNTNQDLKILKKAKVMS